MTTTDYFYIQEIIGGWKQTAVFGGSYEECMDYYEKRITNGNYSIVHEDEYMVDYL